jgi:hypothetical protein
VCKICFLTDTWNRLYIISAGMPAVCLWLFHLERLDCVPQSVNKVRLIMWHAPHRNLQIIS